MKKKMGFDLADVCECEECEEPELTDVQDGHHDSSERVYSPQEMAQAFFDLVVKLRKIGCKEITAFEMNATFEASEKKTPGKKAP
jgi:hypothetical protein